MSKKILSEVESEKLFLECLNYPLFVLELSEYEKQKILDHAFNEYHKLQKKTHFFLSNPEDTSILSESEQSKFFWNNITSGPANYLHKTDIFKKFEDIPEEDQLHYFLTEISDIAINLHVLFKNLGFDMSLNSFELFPTPEEPQQSESSNQLKESKTNNKAEKSELGYTEVSLICFYNNIQIPKSGPEREEICKTYNLKSPAHLYNTFNKIRTKEKMLKSSNPGTLRKHHENIKGYIYENSKKDFFENLKQIRELELKHEKN